MFFQIRLYYLWLPNSTSISQQWCGVCMLFDFSFIWGLQQLKSQNMWPFGACAIKDQT